MRFLAFPEYLRPHLYTTNWIERINKEYRKVLKNKNSMPTEDAVCNLLYLKIRGLTKKYDRQTLNGFTAYQVDIAILWEKFTDEIMRLHTVVDSTPILKKDTSHTFSSTIDV